VWISRIPIYILTEKEMVICKEKVLRKDEKNINDAFDNCFPTVSSVRTTKVSPHSSISQTFDLQQLQLIITGHLCEEEKFGWTCTL